MASLIGLSYLARPLLIAAWHLRIPSVHLTWSGQAGLALVAGVLVLLRPKQVNYIIAGYLIILGLLGIFRFT